jgi:hypothetical protein
MIGVDYDGCLDHGGLERCASRASSGGSVRVEDKSPTRRLVLSSMGRGRASVERAPVERWSGARCPRSTLGHSSSEVGALPTSPVSDDPLVPRLGVSEPA